MRQLTLGEAADAFGARIDVLSAERKRGNLDLPHDPNRRGSAPLYIDAGHGLLIGTFLAMSRLFSNNREVGQLAAEAVRACEAAVLDVLHSRRDTLGYLAIASGIKRKRVLYCDTLEDLLSFQELTALSGEAVVTIPLWPIVNAYLRKLAEINALPNPSARHVRPPQPAVPATPSPATAVITRVEASGKEPCLAVQADGSLVLVAEGEGLKIRMGAAAWRSLAAEAGHLADQLERRDDTLLNVPNVRPDLAAWRLAGAVAGNA